MAERDLVIYIDILDNNDEGFYLGMSSAVHDFSMVPDENGRMWFRVAIPEKLMNDVQVASYFG